MKNHVLLSTALLLAQLLLGAQAQARPKLPVNGLELSLEALDHGYFGLEYRVRGTAYQVRGIADLEPAEAARIRARLAGEQIEVIADKDGAFFLALPVPDKETLEAASSEETVIELAMTKGRFSREWEFPVSLDSPLKTVVHTDRRQYEPGDTVHVWSRVEDAVTGRPLYGIPVIIDVGEPHPRKVITGASGVASVDFVAQTTGGEGRTVRVTPKGGRSVRSDYAVGKRAVTDLLVDVKVEPAIAAPGDAVTLSVSVTSVRGTPARGAAVSIEVSSKRLRAVTDKDGIATFSVKAQEVISGNESSEPFTGIVRSTGARPADFSGSFLTRRPAFLDAEVLLPHGGLVPEVDEALLLSVRLSDGSLPAPGAVVKVDGSAFRKSVTAPVDRHGLASVPIRIGPEDYAVHAAGACAEEAATTVSMVLKAPNTSKSKKTLCIPVLHDAQVVPVVRPPAVSPDDSFEVRVARRPSAKTLPVRVSLHCEDGAGPVAVKTIAPSKNVVRFTAPEKFLGRCTVLARPERDVRSAATLGLGARETVLVRPRRPSFPTLSLDRDVYPIKGTARLTVHAPEDVPRSWVVVVARDLAQHQGERPFEEYFLRAKLKHAVLDPSTPDADRLVRAALVQYAWRDEDIYKEDGSPGPRMETDAARRGIELRTATAGRWMAEVERRLFRALDEGTVADITVEKNGRRRFIQNLVGIASDDESEDAKTLGLGEVTVEMLTALDPGFTFDNAAKRAARRRLVQLSALLAEDLNPDENDETRPLGHAIEPPERRLSDLVRRGMLAPKDLLDPWGNSFVIKNTGRTPRFVFSEDSAKVELLSPGPDGRAGSADDIRDPWARAIPEGTLYARASGEDRLMARLSAVSPGTDALNKLLMAYDRLNDEAVEELIGDAFGLGLSGIGRGGGGGSGSGYGRGTGGLDGRRGGSPRIRSGASLIGRALAGMLREEFPATLDFKSEVLLSPSGQTELAIPLAHAATTYLVEVILWREDGWRWSAATTFRVNQDILIDAPVPETVAVGDEIELPVRLANRTKTARTVKAAIEGSAGLGIGPIEIDAVTVPAEDVVEIPVRIALTRKGEGKIVLAAQDTSGNTLDAVRRPIAVRPSRRRARESVSDVLLGHGALELVVPDGAVPISNGSVSLSTGASFFQEAANPIDRRWLNSATDGIVPAPMHASMKEAMGQMDDDDPMDLALFVGAQWTNGLLRDIQFDRALEILSDRVEQSEGSEARNVNNLSRVLMRLAPAVGHADARKGKKKALLALVRALRIRIEDRAAKFINAPWLHARAAAAILWTATKKDDLSRAREFLRRAREGLVDIGEDRRLEGGAQDENGDDSFGAGALLALAELLENRRVEASRLIRSLVRFSYIDAFGASLGSVEPRDRIPAAAAAALLSGKPASKLSLFVDGAAHTVPLDNGDGTLALPNLGRGGRHRIEVRTDGPGVLLVFAAAEYTAPWHSPPPLVGPFFTSIDGKAGIANGRSELILRIRNRTPRAVSRPTVEVTLPAGAEVDDTAIQKISRFTTEEPRVLENRLTLRLRPLRPRESREIPLPWLWTLAGKFTGLGTMSWAADRPEAITVSSARPTDVPAASAVSGGLP